MKKIIIGFLVGSILFGGIGVYAAGGSKSINVNYTIKDIKIDNVSQMPEKAPFAYEGTTYVPLRYIAEKLGEPVKWEGETQTIYIGDMGEETAVYPGNGMDYMNYQEGYSSNFLVESYQSGKIKDNVGNEYDKFVRMGLDYWAYGTKEGWNFVEYPLNGNYEELKATVGLTENSKNTTRVVDLIIYADDKQIYSKELKAGYFPEEINLDIKNAMKVKIELRHKDGKSDFEAGLFNLRFIK